jgi:thymidylate kinase
MHLPCLEALPTTLEESKGGSMLIVIEGADGCGKDSVADAVAKEIGASRMNFPNDRGVTGPAIREYLKKKWWVSRVAPGEYDDHLSALAFQALQIANRMEFMGQLERASEHGETPLVLARYWQSAWVYGQLDGLDPTFLVRVHEYMAQANLNILLSATAETCMARRSKRDGDLIPERYEGKLDFTRKVAALYDKLWSDTTAFEGRWDIVNAEQPLEKVVGDIMAAYNGVYGLSRVKETY